MIASCSRMISILLLIGVAPGSKLSSLQVSGYFGPRKHNPFNFDYFISNTKLSSVKSIKAHGIEISSKLDWNIHINSVVKKCNRKMGLIIQRTVGFNALVNVTKAL